MSERHGWCSLRLRFDERELELLRGAERLRGSAMAFSARPEQLRTALALAKAGQKVGRGVPGGTVSLDEGELELLLEAVRYSVGELHASSDGDRVTTAFPELVEKGTWRAFGLARELEALGTRLDGALRA